MKRFIPILAVLLIVALWLCALFVGYTFFPNWAERGQFGDLFGSVNALFSGLAFLGLIYAILLQRKELSLQREELKLQREEMAGSRAELAAQVAVQKSMLQATIGQIKVAAEQARIEALKMESGKKSPSARGDWVRKIDEKASAINKIANEMELID